MPTRHAACSCGQLYLTIEGEPSRISMCHCLECPPHRRRDEQPARFQLYQSHLPVDHFLDADWRKWQRIDL